jgi:uncharacterized protein YukJ
MNNYYLYDATFTDGTVERIIAIDLHQAYVIAQRIAAACDVMVRSIAFTPRQQDPLPHLAARDRDLPPSDRADN